MGYHLTAHILTMPCCILVSAKTSHPFGPQTTLPVSRRLAVVAINQKQALAQLIGLFYLVYRQRINTLKQ